MPSHSLGVAEAMCHRVATTEKRKIIAVGTPEQLRSQAEHQHGALEGVFLKLPSPSGDESDQH